MPSADALRPLPVRHPGRHRRATPARSRVGLAATVLGRLGSLVTLAALMVLAAAVGGMADGVPVTEDAAVTVTFGSR